MRCAALLEFEFISRRHVCLSVYLSARSIQRSGSSSYLRLRHSERAGICVGVGHPGLSDTRRSGLSIADLTRDAGAGCHARCASQKLKHFFASQTCAGDMKIPASHALQLQRVSRNKLSCFWCSQGRNTQLVLRKVALHESYPTSLSSAVRNKASSLDMAASGKMYAVIAIDMIGALCVAVLRQAHHKCLPARRTRFNVRRSRTVLSKNKREI